MLFSAVQEVRAQLWECEIAHKQFKQDDEAEIKGLLPIVQIKTNGKNVI